MRLPLLSVFGLLTAARLLVAADAPRGELIAVGQMAESVELVAADASGNLRFRAGEERTELHTDQLIRWSHPAQPRNKPVVALADGGLLVAESVEFADERFTFTSPSLGTVEVAAEQVRGILFQPSLDQAHCDAQWLAIIDASGQQDRLLLDNDDQLSGMLTGMRSDPRGSDDPAYLAINADVGEIEIAPARVKTLLLDPSLVAQTDREDSPLWLGLDDGSRLRVSSLAIDSDQAHFAISGDAQCQASRTKIVFLQAAGEQVVYLSDLEPLDYRHVPYLDLLWPSTADRSVSGGLLRAGGHLYLKGISLHSAARITYRLDPRDQRFAAQVAIDDAAGNSANVVCRVFVDREERHAQPLRYGDAPQSVDVDVAGGKLLSLIVDFGEWGDVDDHVDWLDARLVRGPQ